MAPDAPLYSKPGYRNFEPFAQVIRTDGPIDARLIEELKITLG